MVSSPRIIPSSLRVLAPAAGCAPVLDFLSASSWLSQNYPELKGEQKLHTSLKLRLSKHFSVEEAWLLASGKEALYRLFLALADRDERRNIAVAAYTCPDIVVAAAKAGFGIIPLDLSLRTLELDPESISVERFSSCAAIVFSNLYGLPDSLEPWRERCRDANVLMIDDACQSAYSSRAGVGVGSEPGIVSVLSFGRGKSLSGVGGGALLVSKDVLDSKLGESLRHSLGAGLGSAGIARSASEFLACVLQWMFSNPFMYRLPASLPWLRLGETVIRGDFRCGAIGVPAVLQAAAQLCRQESMSRMFMSKVSKWQERINDLSLIQPLVERVVFPGSEIVPTRYPVLVPDGIEREALRRCFLKEGLGINASYPVTIDKFPELRSSVQENECLEANKVAHRILTLPLHRYVRRKDMDRAMAIFQDLL